MSNKNTEEKKNSIVKEVVEMGLYMIAVFLMV